MMRLLLAMLGIATALGFAAPARAITTTPFGPTGEGGDVNGQTLTIGAGGRVHELDAFVSVGGGPANQLSVDGVPAGLALSFSASLSADATDLTLTYALRNVSGGDLFDVSVISFVDAEIDEVFNSFFNEFAATDGFLASGQNFEVDEPGFSFGDIFDNALAGALDGTNAVDETAPEDVSMALQLSIAQLGLDETFVVRVMLSEDGDRLGTFAIAHGDSDPQSTTVITYSAAPDVRGAPTSPIPEPNGALALLAAGVVLAWIGRESSLRRA